jgi:hypothetical protein
MSNAIFNDIITNVTNSPFVQDAVSDPRVKDAKNLAFKAAKANPVVGKVADLALNAANDPRFQEVANSALNVATNSDVGKNNTDLSSTLNTAKETDSGKTITGALKSIMDNAKESSDTAKEKFEKAQQNQKHFSTGRGETTSRQNSKTARFLEGTDTGMPINNLNGQRIFELDLSEKSKEYNNEPSFYVIIAIILKGIVSYTWDFIVLTIKTFYRVFTDLVLIPFFIFLPYVFDVLAVILILILVVLVIIYFVSGGKNRPKENNMFDNMLSGFTMFMMPDVGGYVKKSGSVLKEKTGGFIESIKDFFDSIGEGLNDFFKSIFRLIKSEANINDIDDNNKHERTKNTGRCDNISQIEEKDGRYCYEQLGKKEIDWGDKKIDYKLLKATHMKNQNKNTHYDYYVPNCKGSNIFTKEFIASCKDSKRTKFICKI